jgi:hypothetical protein
VRPRDAFVVREMTNETNTKDVLTRAAHLAAEAGVELDEFMRAAWSAYVDARPGLRDEIATAKTVARLEQLRERGLIPSA